MWVASKRKAGRPLHGLDAGNFLDGFSLTPRVSDEDVVRRIQPAGQPGTSSGPWGNTAWAGRWAG